MALNVRHPSLLLAGQPNAWTFSLLFFLESVARATLVTVLPLTAYDHIIVSFSGGKDSMALVLDLLERGVPRERIQLWHQEVDGEAGVDQPFMDWPITRAYCVAVAAFLGIRLFFQWRLGGFLTETGFLKETAHA